MTAGGWRNAGYGLAVLCGLGVLAVGPWLVTIALPETGPPLNGPVQVGSGVSFDPPPGSRYDLADSRPGDGEVLLRLDGRLRIRVKTQDYQGEFAPYAAHAWHKLDRDQGLRRIGPTKPLTTSGGLRGEWGSLRGADPDPETGCYAVFAGDSTGVAVLVTGVRDCDELPPAVRTALDSLREEHP